MNKLKELFFQFPKLSAALLGALYPIGFAPFNWVIPSLVSIAGMYLLWSQQTPKAARNSGFVFGFVAFIVGANWVLTSVGVFGGAPMWLAMLILIGLVSIMGLYFAAQGFVTSKYLPKLSSEKTISRNLLAILLFASLWVVLEWLRSWVLSGFPWLNTGYLSINNPIAGFAPIGGVHFASFLFVCLALSFVALFKAGKAFRITSLVSIAVILNFGFALQSVDWSVAYDEPFSVALIQGGVPQDKKWAKEQLPKTINLYTELSLKNADVDLLVWPEAALPTLRRESYDLYKLIKKQLKPEAGFLMSSLTRLPDKPNGAEDVRNGFYIIDKDFGMADEQVYFKQHLVPYGEYFPLPQFLIDWMRRNKLLYGDVTPGKKGQPALKWNNLQIGAFICYEDAYPNIVRDMLPEANFLVNVTNDAWFSGSFAPYQHLQITQMRSLEMARPTLRATNDGITAIIDYKGRVVDTVPQYQPEVLRGTVQGRKGATPYIKFGNWPILLLCWGHLIWFFVKPKLFNKEH